MYFINMVLCILKYVQRDLMLSAPPKNYTYTKEHKEIFEVMVMFSSLVLLVMSQMYVYVQTHQDVFIKCVQF